MKSTEKRVIGMCAPEPQPNDMQTLVCDAAIRLDAYLGAVTALSRNAAQRLIRAGDVLVNGEAAKVNRVLKIGDTVTVRYPTPKPVDALPEDIPLDIVYQDEALLVVNKPQGMVVHPAPGHESGTLVNGLMYHITDLSGIGGEMRPGIVHRIDRMTSGLLVVAKNDLAHRLLSEQFKSHTARRAYIAIVEGNIKQDDGSVCANIGRHRTDRKRMAVTADGREAITRFHVLDRFGSRTLLKLELETGRTHQIRVHMAYIKHPVTGDAVYGRSAPNLGLCGQALHAYRLCFRHPVTEQEVVFYAPPPPWFMHALELLGDRQSADAFMNRLQNEPVKESEARNESYV